MAIVKSSQESGSLIRDALTGAYSRALFQERWPDELDRARRYATSLALCILDLDYFKSINDAFGHHRGDLILKELVHRIRLTIRGSDIFFRYGGDEFLLLLPNTTRVQATELCDRILQMIGGTPFPGDPPVSLGASIGIASFPDDGSDGEEIFHVADLRCYEAKRRGRNRSIAADPQETLASASDSSRLIERDEALAEYQSFLEKFPRLGKGIFLVRGQPGSGRTRFLSEAANLARMRNFCVWPVSNKKEMLTPGEEPDHVAIVSALETAPPAFAAIAALLDARKQTGLVCCVDRMEGLEGARARWLEWLLSPECPFPVAVVWTCSPGTYFDLGSKLDCSVTVELGPLTEDGTRIFLRNVLRWDVPPEFLTWFYRQTGGFPKQVQQGVDRLIRQNILQAVSETEWRISPTYESIDLREWLAKTSTAPPNNLPVVSTAFLGRDEELEQLHHLMLDHRLVTLTGPGGIGKSRLALQAAHYCMAEFPDGAFFVQLSETRDATLLLPTLARALGIIERPDQTVVESVRAYLRNKRLLLVLDTFEHITEAAVSVADLLANAPHLHVMVTSRQPLRISGEQLFAVAPLAWPEDPESLSPMEFGRYSAVALFVARAQSVRLDFHLTPENRSAVVRLCRRLDGVPLALELAAARIGQYSPEEMLTKSSLTLLSRAPTDFPQRHQTLRAVVLWSVDLLAQSDQELFAVLGLFHGPFVRTAAMSLFSSETNPGMDAAESLLTLAEHNLLEQRIDRDDIIHYRMLRAVRETAMDLLQENPNRAVYQKRFCTYYIDLAENHMPDRVPLLQKDWLESVSRENDNLRAAMEYLLEMDPGEATRLAVALCPYWEIRNVWSEALAYLQRIAERADPTRPATVELLLWIGRFSRLHGDYPAAEKILQDGIALCQSANRPTQVSPLLQELGWVVYVQGEHKIGRGYFEQALEISKGSDDTLQIAHCLGNLGWLEEHDSNLPQAVELLEESRALFQRLGRKSDEAAVLRRLSRVEFTSGRYARAEELAGESLALSRELGDIAATGYAMHRLGEIARASGHYDRAGNLLRDSLEILEKAQAPEGVEDALLSLAEFMRSLRRYDEAIDLYQRHLKLARSMGMMGAVSRSLKDQGEIARYQGRLEDAESLLREALSILQQYGYHGDYSWIHRAMGELCLQKGDPAAARAHFQESLQPHFEAGGMLLLVLNMSGLIGVALQEGRKTKAAVLQGSLEKVMEANRHLIAVDDLHEYERRLQSVRSGLPDEEWQKATAQGRSLSLHQAMLLALMDSDETDPASNSGI